MGGEKKKKLNCEYLRLLMRNKLRGGKKESDDFQYSCHVVCFFLKFFYSKLLEAFKSKNCWGVIDHPPQKKKKAFHNKSHIILFVGAYPDVVII